MEMTKTNSFLKNNGIINPLVIKLPLLLLILLLLMLFLLWFSLSVSCSTLNKCFKLLTASNLMQYYASVYRFLYKIKYNNPCIHQIQDICLQLPTLNLHHVWPRSLRCVFTPHATSLFFFFLSFFFLFPRCCGSQKMCCFSAAPHPHKQPVYNCLG